ncbi:nucleotide modification associated domain-containing protein [uncultured Lactobacillus sp.]|uniref:nucleotide modification associated domain-containing protein n=1 Tax=uncultured Lactobacillus sp. TaxID=153152 RepID=UPI002611369D|nr:nucleotide modification associated domain-containing protein [uncultured Lactobacillus sp.]
MGNNFKTYTDKLADILQAKNQAYGDSFTKSLDEDGLLVLKIRLGDKFNRISSLIKRDELKENDESLEDTLLDLAGYSILGLKYLKEHENEGN